MVLVSKLGGRRSSAPCETEKQQAGNTNSFFNKIRSTFVRSASSPSLLGGQPVQQVGGRQVLVGQKNWAKHLSCVERFDEGTSSDTSAGKSSPSSTSSCPSACQEDNGVMLSDFEADTHTTTVSAAKSCKQHLRPFSICGSDCDQEGNSAADEVLPAAETVVEAEPSLRGPVMEVRCMGDAISCSILGDSQSPSTHSPQVVGQGELPGRLWDPADPPAKAHAAWHSRRNKEAQRPQGQRTRFPARLPPLGGLAPLASFSSKNLRECCRKATPVMEVSFPPPVDVKAQ